jgi:hypothetical protein
MLNAKKLRKYEAKCKARKKRRNLGFWLDIFDINQSLKHNIKDRGAISLEVPETTVNNPLYMYKDYYLNKGFKIETYKESVSDRESIIIRWNE